MTIMSWRPSWQNALRGGVIYGAGDSVATLIGGEFQWPRMLGVILLGASVYATEIPAYFAWLDRRFSARTRANAIRRALLAQAFFNPLWIARHLLCLRLFSGRWQDIDERLLTMAVDSFLHIVPLGVLINYLIQNQVPLNWRFGVSASYSALMAIYFALSEVWFA